MLNRKKMFNFDFRLVLVLLIVLIGSQLVMTFYSKNAFHSFLINTQEWYQNFSVKRIANLTSTSLELLVETQINQEQVSPIQRNKIINSLDIIFSQHIMEKNAEEICLFLYDKNEFVTFDNGTDLFAFFYDGHNLLNSSEQHLQARRIFDSIKYELIKSSNIQIEVRNEKVFHVFVPFVPDGEFLGALYMKIIPDFAPISEEFIGSYNNFSWIYLLLISSGLVLIYIVFTITLQARDKAQQLAYQEHEKFIKEKFDREKENAFTMRIYHAYHKAEKMIGFINNDLEILDEKNVPVIKERVYKYSNFIGRIIYDMKYYDPPLHSIINPMFKTRLNEVLDFIIDNLFLRIYRSSDMFLITRSYDENIPIINVNEYVVWEIVEPLIRNSINHNSDKQVTINVSCNYDKAGNRILIEICDDGKGIKNELLERKEDGIKKIFLENVTTKSILGGKYGLGCYIAHSLATKFLGWEIDVVNLEEKGCKFSIIIPLA